MTEPAGPKQQASRIDRRTLLKAGAAGSIAIFVSTACQGGRNNATAAPPTPTAGDLFLGADEMKTLKALVDTLIPEDIDPGAAATGCADAINFLLSAFSFNPPMIFAGGPFSDRGGATQNDFKHFVPLDQYEEQAWRLKIEGSLGRPEREFNGPRKGWQAIYREGLDRLNTRAQELGFASFAQMPGPARDALINDDSDPLIAELKDIAVPHTLETMYGAPEYGGNRNLNGWSFTAYDGDVQPRGYTDEEVTSPDNPGLTELLTRARRQANHLPVAALLPVPDQAQQTLIENAFFDLMAMSSSELALTAMLNAESRLSRLQQEIDKFRPSRSGKADAR